MPLQTPLWRLFCLLVLRRIPVELCNVLIDTTFRVCLLSFFEAYLQLFPLFRLQSYNFFPINPSVFCNFLPIELLIVIKLPVSNHISFGLRLVSGMTGCMGDEVGQTSSISMAFMLEVILRSNRSVFNDHITVKFVLKLFQTYIISDYFLYLCNGLTFIAIHEVND